jgi:hypothetical protein
MTEPSVPISSVSRVLKRHPNDSGLDVPVDSLYTAWGGLFTDPDTLPFSRNGRPIDFPYQVNRPRLLVFCRLLVLASQIVEDVWQFIPHRHLENDSHPRSISPKAEQDASRGNQVSIGPSVP